MKDDATSWLRRGYVYARKGELDKAIADFTEAIRLDAEDGEAYFQRALAYARKKDMDQALADYKEVFRLEPMPVEGYKEWGPAEDSKSRGELMDQLETALQKFRDEAKAHVAKAVALQKEGKLDEAIAEYDQAVWLYPRCPEVHFNRGLAYQQKGQLENAVIDYTQAIELDPRFTAAYGNRGFRLFQTPGVLGGAMADFNKVAGIGSEG